MALFCEIPNQVRDDIGSKRGPERIPLFVFTLLSQAFGVGSKSMRAKATHSVGTRV